MVLKGSLSLTYLDQGGVTKPSKMCMVFSGKADWRLGIKILHHPVQSEERRRPKKNKSVYKWGLHRQGKTRHRQGWKNTNLNFCSEDEQPLTVINHS